MKGHEEECAQRYNTLWGAVSENSKKVNVGFGIMIAAQVFILAGGIVYVFGGGS